MAEDRGALRAPALAGGVVRVAAVLRAVADAHRAQHAPRAVREDLPGLRLVHLGVWLLTQTDLGGDPATEKPKIILQHFCYKSQKYDDPVNSI